MAAEARDGGADGEEWNLQELLRKFQFSNGRQAVQLQDLSGGEKARPPAPACAAPIRRCLAAAAPCLAAAHRLPVGACRPAFRPSGRPAFRPSGLRDLLPSGLRRLDRAPLCCAGFTRQNPATTPPEPCYNPAGILLEPCHNPARTLPVHSTAQTKLWQRSDRVSELVFARVSGRVSNRVFARRRTLTRGALRSPRSGGWRC